MLSAVYHGPFVACDNVLGQVLKAIQFHDSSQTFFLFIFILIPFSALLSNIRGRIVMNLISRINIESRT